MYISILLSSYSNNLLLVCGPAPLTITSFTIIQIRTRGKKLSPDIDDKLS